MVGKLSSCGAKKLRVDVKDGGMTLECLRGERFKNRGTGQS